MIDNTKIPMDDPPVKEIIADLRRQITQDDLNNLERSLKRRNLISVWNQHVRPMISTNLPDDTCTDHWWVGMSWSWWFKLLAQDGTEVRPVLDVLAEAGVLGTSWLSSARDRVWEAQGWK